MNFEQKQYALIVEELLARNVPYALVPSGGTSEAREGLAGLSHESIFPDAQVADRDMADACLSGLWLRFDFLDRSHTISQEIHTSTGSFWHGIMHRREPDWSNAKYWFHKTGEHEIFPDLLSAAKQCGAKLELPAPAKVLLNSATWDPFAFVDLCETAHRQASQLTSFCQRVQLAEWQLLFDFCYQRATA